MKPRDLLSHAAALVSVANGRPSDVNLRRATSAAYYAMFHCLAAECANSFIGGEGSDRSAPAWRQVYRALQHTQVSDHCKRQTFIRKFPKGIADFANHFVTMQEKRHSADYDPVYKFAKSEVVNDIAITNGRISSFEKCPKADRRAFCAYVLFKVRSV